MKPVDTHWLRQNGQLTSSPTAFLRPLPRTPSLSSAGPSTPSYRVNGARRGLVTLSFDTRRATFTIILDRLDNGLQRKLIDLGSALPVVGELIPEIPSTGRLRPQSEFTKVANVIDP